MQREYNSGIGAKLHSDEAALEAIANNLPFCG